MVLLCRKSFNQLPNSLFQCNLSKSLTSWSGGSHTLLLCAVPHSQPGCALLWVLASCVGSAGAQMPSWCCPGQGSAVVLCACP